MLLTSADMKEFLITCVTGDGPCLRETGDGPVARETGDRPAVCGTVDKADTPVVCETVDGASTRETGDRPAVCETVGQLMTDNKSSTVELQLTADPSRDVSAGDVNSTNWRWTLVTEHYLKLGETDSYACVFRNQQHR